MPIRFAMKISEELLVMVKEWLDVETDNVFEDNTYVVVEALSPTEFTAKIMSEDSVFEAFKQDSNLHIM